MLGDQKGLDGFLEKLPSHLTAYQCHLKVPVTLLG